MKAGLLGLIPHEAPVVFPQFVEHFAKEILHLRLCGLFSTYILEPAVGKVKGGGMAVGGVGHGIAVHLHQLPHVILRSQHRGDDNLILSHLVLLHRFLKLLPDIFQEFCCVGGKVWHRMGKRVNGVVFVFFYMFEFPFHTPQVIPCLQRLDAVLLCGSELMGIVVIKPERPVLRHCLPMACASTKEQTDYRNNDSEKRFSNHTISISLAKVRLSERNAKEKTKFFLSIPEREYLRPKVKGTIK